MSQQQPTQMREVVVSGYTHDGTQSLVATMLVPADHVHLVEAYHLANGYKVTVPTPDTHTTPVEGELFSHPDEILHPAYHAHAQHLKALGVTDVHAHAASLRGN